MQRLIVAFNRVCDKRKLRINGKMSKVMRVSENGLVRDMRIRMGREEVKQVENYSYLRVEISAEGSMKEEILHRMNEGRSVLGDVKEVWKKGGLTMGMKKRIYESVVVLKIMYGCQAWNLNENDRHNLEVFERKGLRSLCGSRKETE